MALNQPIFQITIPLIIAFVVTIWAASWSQNKRTEDIRESLNKRLDEIIERLKNIGKKLENHSGRIAKLEVARWQ